jgi:hypothetical protein
MADTATDPTSTDPTTTTPPPAPDAPTATDDTTDWKAEAEKFKTLSRKHEERAKANAAAAKELEQVRQQHMTEQEKAVEQARAEGRSEAVRASSERVVSAEIRAAAAGRLSKEQLDELVDGINTAKFVDDDGDVDVDKVQRFVDGIAPAPTDPGFPDLGQGARGAGTGGSADQLLDDVKRLTGTR